MKQRLGTNTHIHAGQRGNWVKVTWQLGWTPDPQALEGDSSLTPPSPHPRVCGRRRGLMSVWGPHGNVTREWPGQAAGPWAPREKVKLLTGGPRTSNGLHVCASGTCGCLLSVGAITCVYLLTHFQGQRDQSFHQIMKGHDAQRS